MPHATLANAIIEALNPVVIVYIANMVSKWIRQQDRDV